MRNDTKAKRKPRKEEMAKVN